MILILLLLPFIQIGWSFYISIQSASLFLFLKRYKYFYSSTDLAVGAFLLITFISNFIFTTASYHDYLIIFREILCFMLIIASTYGLKKISLHSSILTIKITIFILFIIVSIQFAGINFYNFFISLPVEMFIANKESLEGIYDNFEYSLRFRAPATFGEPSYCSGVLTVLYYIQNKYKPSLFFEIITIITILLMESLAGTILMSYLLFIKYSKRIDYSFLFIFVIIMFGSVFLLKDTEIFDRVALLIKFDFAKDESANIRLVEPFEIINDIFINKGQYLGISDTQMRTYFSVDRINIDNGILYLIIAHGFLIFPILGYISYKIKDVKLFIFFMLLIQLNGGILTFDKTVIYSILFGFNKTLNKSNSAQIA